jgi:hypothetical protein
LLLLQTAPLIGEYTINVGEVVSAETKLAEKSVSSKKKLIVAIAIFLLKFLGLNKDYPLRILSLKVNITCANMVNSTVDREENLSK